MSNVERENCNSEKSWALPLNLRLFQDQHHWSLGWQTQCWERQQLCFMTFPQFKSKNRNVAATTAGKNLSNRKMQIDARKLNLNAEKNVSATSIVFWVWMQHKTWHCGMNVRDGARYRKSYNNAMIAATSALQLDAAFMRQIITHRQTMHKKLMRCKHFFKFNNT